MTQFQMPTQMFVCQVDDQHIFLDLAQDRYFCLPPDEERGFTALLEGAGTPPSCSSLAALIRTGVIVASGDGKPIARTAHPLPEHSLPETTNELPPARLRDISEVLLLVWSSRRAVARKALPSALSGLSAHSANARGGCRALLEELVLRFLAARRYVPIAPNCLYDSLALRRFLRRRQATADLVIGVKLRPFGAHCWLQDGSTVLNDTLGGARVFQPVLVA
jgi:hypothetical protein